MTGAPQTDPSSPAETAPRPPLVIIGAGGHAVSVASVALSAGHTIHCFVDRLKAGSQLLGFEIIGDVGDLENWARYGFAIAIGDNAIRERVYAELRSRAETMVFPPLIHAAATLLHPPLPCQTGQRTKAAR